MTSLEYVWAVQIAEIPNDAALTIDGGGQIVFANPAQASASVPADAGLDIHLPPAIVAEPVDVVAIADCRDVAVLIGNSALVAANSTTHATTGSQPGLTIIGPVTLPADRQISVATSVLPAALQVTQVHAVVSPASVFGTAGADAVVTISAGTVLRADQQPTAHARFALSDGMLTVAARVGKQKGPRAIVFRQIAAIVAEKLPGVTIYYGQILSVVNGYAMPLIAGEKFLGIAIIKEPFRQEPLLTTPENARRIIISKSTVLDVMVRGYVRVQVVGVTSASDIRKLVHATDDMTFSLTGSDKSRVGRVYSWISGSTCLVAILPLLSDLPDDQPTEPNP